MKDHTQLTSLHKGIERPKVLWRQVADQLRRQILTKELKPGHKLPPTAEIARTMGIDAMTVHRAQTSLVREGLLTRARKVGTHVAAPKGSLSRIGVYFESNTSHTPGQFTIAIQNAILAFAYERKMEILFFFDPRPAELQNTMPDNLAKAIRDGEIEALISSISAPRHLVWLRSIKVPMVYIGSRRDASVRTNFPEFVKLGLQALKEKGCRSVSMILPPISIKPNIFIKNCEALGLQYRPEWLNTSQGPIGIPEYEFEAWGYHAFQKLWEFPQRPEGLIVFPDSMARGVLMALLAAAVRVPSELRLVLHKNDEIDMFCPVEATFVGTCVRELVEALFLQLNTRYQGKPTSSILLPAHLITT